jgi:hypothetical protein
MKCHFPGWTHSSRAAASGRPPDPRALLPGVAGSMPPPRAGNTGASRQPRPGRAAGTRRGL